jgi:hypothetical protein
MMALRPDLGPAKKKTRSGSFPSCTHELVGLQVESVGQGKNILAPRKMEDNNAEHLKWGIDLSNAFSVQ